MKVAGRSYIFIADIGDNRARSRQYFIYRFEEPTASTDTVYAIEKISFRYPDGSHDAEAMLIDNITKDIYLITKRDTLSKIYKLPYPQSTSSVNTATYVGSLGFNGVVSASCSADGLEIIVKTYFSISYWKRNRAEAISDVLKKKPLLLSYMLEPQGEAACFKNDKSGFYTLSEKPFFSGSVDLNFYKRK